MHSSTATTPRRSSVVALVLVGLAVLTALAGAQATIQTSGLPSIMVIDQSGGRLNLTGNFIASGSITTASGLFSNGGVTIGTGTAPVATTFCTTPSVPNANGTYAWTINVGTACATSVATITMPAASTGWVVECHNVTAPATNVVEQTGGTTTTATLTNYARTTGLAANWTDSNILRCKGTGY